MFLSRLSYSVWIGRALSRRLNRFEVTGAPFSHRMNASGPIAFLLPVRTAGGLLSGLLQRSSQLRPLPRLRPDIRPNSLRRRRSAVRQAIVRAAHRRVPARLAGRDCDPLALPGGVRVQPDEFSRSDQTDRRNLPGPPKSRWRGCVRRRLPGRQSERSKWVSLIGRGFSTFPGRAPLAGAARLRSS